LFNIPAAEETIRERPDLIVAGQRTKETNTPCSFIIYTQAAVVCGVLAADLI